MRRILLLGLLFVAATPEIARSEDNEHFSLVISRKFNLVYGRVAKLKVLIDDEHMGSVTNGTRARYSVPVNDSGKYTLGVRNPVTLADGPSTVFTAKPGDEVVATVGIEWAWVDGTTIFGVTTFPRQRAMLHVVPPRGGMSLAINDRAYRVDGRLEIATEDATTTNHCLRLKIRAKGKTSKLDESFVLFAHPGETSWLDFSAELAEADRSLLATAAYVVQLRGCVLHHIGIDLLEVAGVLDKLEADLTAIPTASVLPEAIAFRDAQMTYLRRVDDLTDDSLLGRAALNFALAAVECGAEAFITRSVPTRLDALTQTFQAAAETAYEEYSASKELAAASVEFQKVEESFIGSFKERLSRSQVLQRHPLVRQLLGAELGDVSSNGVEVVAPGGPGERQTAAPSAQQSSTVTQNSAAPVGPKKRPEPGFITNVGGKSRTLVEARFAYRVAAPEGANLVVYRDGEKLTKLGSCRVVRCQDSRLVAECLGFRAEVGDLIASPSETP